MTLLIRLLVNAVALWCAARFIDGIDFGGSWLELLAIALVFGVVNTLIRPVLKLLSLPIRILTLGLFTLVLNAFMLLLTAWICVRLEIPFSVRGFVPAFLGALLISVVATVLNALLVRDDDD